MIRRSIAGAILGVSLLVGSFAWWGFLAQRTVLDPDRSREVAEELLDNGEVRAQLVENISGALTTSIPDDVPIPDEVVNNAAEQVLNDPAIEELFLRAFTDSHAAFLGDGDAPRNIDLTPVAASARSAVVAATPQLDDVLPATPVLNVPLPTEHIPNASPVRSFLERVVPVLAVGAIIGAGVALFTTTDRPGVLRRAGTWALTSTAVYLVLGLGVPYLLRRFAPDGWEVLAALMAALLRATLVPSIVLGIVGAGLLGLSGVWAVGGARSGRPRVRVDDEPRRSASRRASEAPTPPSAGVPHPHVGMPTRRQQQPAPQRGPQWERRPATPTRPQPVVPRQSEPRPQSGAAPGRYPDAATTAQARRVPHTASPQSDVPASSSGGARSPYPDGPGGQGAGGRPSPYPDGPGGQGAGERPSPYPDGTGGQGAGERPSPYPDGPGGQGLGAQPSPPPDGGGGAAAHSVFADAARPNAAGTGLSAGGADPYAPRWLAGQGWVLHPDDPRPPPQNARWVDGVGHIVPGPPPS